MSLNRDELGQPAHIALVLGQALAGRRSAGGDVFHLPDSLRRFALGLYAYRYAIMAV